MIRARFTMSVLKAFAMLSLLALLATMLLACGEEDDVDDGVQPTATAPAAAPATATATIASQPTATTQDPATQAPSTQPTATPGTSPAPIPTTTPDRIDHPTGADQTVLHVETEGGFAPQLHLLTGLPLFVLDGAGCYVMQGPQIEIFPQPALPNLLETCLQEEGVQYILAAARDAGLLEGDAHYPMDMMADATTTVFTINADGRSIRVSAYALLEGSDEFITGKDADAQKAARAKLREFLTQIGDLQGWLPPNVVVSTEQPYDIARLQLVTLPSDAPSAPQVTGPPQPEQTWPLDDALSGFGAEYLSGGYRCGVIEGNDLATLLPDLERANQQTRWTSGDRSYILYLRPLLAGEEGCAAE